MIDAFEDHCWQDVIGADVLELYRPYRREVYVGDAAALIAIDLYEMAYEGGPGPIAEVTRTYPSACGEYAWRAMAPTQRVFPAARAAGLPIFYSTGETRPDARPGVVVATKRRNISFAAAGFAIRPEF